MALHFATRLSQYSGFDAASINEDSKSFPLYAARHVSKKRSSVGRSKLFAWFEQMLNTSLLRSEGSGRRRRKMVSMKSYQNAQGNSFKRTEEIIHLVGNHQNVLAVLVDLLAYRVDRKALLEKIKRCHKDSLHRTELHFFMQESENVVMDAIIFPKIEVQTVSEDLRACI